MKRAQGLTITMVTGTLVAGVAGSMISTSSSVGAAGSTLRQRFTHNGQLRDEGPAGAFDHQGRTGPPRGNPTGATEAPTGFDNVTNGFTPQGPPFESLDEDNVKALRSFNDNRFIFEEVETTADGLGPTYNGQSCRECHQNVATGGASQITVQRTGRTVDGQFFESLGRSLLHSRATNA